MIQGRRHEISTSLLYGRISVDRRFQNKFKRPTLRESRWYLYISGGKDFSNFQHTKLRSVVGCTDSLLYLSPVTYKQHGTLLIRVNKIFLTQRYIIENKDQPENYTKPVSEFMTAGRGNDGLNASSDPLNVSQNFFSFLREVKTVERRQFTEHRSAITDCRDGWINKVAIHEKKLFKLDSEFMTAGRVNDVLKSSSDSLIVSQFLDLLQEVKMDNSAITDIHDD